jgi:hypothetical protein
MMLPLALRTDGSCATLQSLQRLDEAALDVAVSEVSLYRPFARPKLRVNGMVRSYRVWRRPQEIRTILSNVADGGQRVFARRNDDQLFFPRDQSFTLSEKISIHQR